MQPSNGNIIELIKPVIFPQPCPKSYPTIWCDVRGALNMSTLTSLASLTFVSVFPDAQGMTQKPSSRYTAIKTLDALQCVTPKVS